MIRLTGGLEVMNSENAIEGHYIKLNDILSNEARFRIISAIGKREASW